MLKNRKYKNKEIIRIIKVEKNEILQKLESNKILLRLNSKEIDKRNQQKI